MLGKTNATVSTGGSGGGGATVQAVNKTGSAISTGQKVWLNQNATTAGSNYQLSNYNPINYIQQAFIDRSGTFGWNYIDLLNIGDSSATRISSFSANMNSLKYMDDNSIFANNSRIDKKMQYTLTGNNIRGISGSYFFNYDSSQAKIQKYDVITGTLQQEFIIPDYTYDDGYIAYYNDSTFFDLSNNKNKITLNPDNQEVTLSSIVINNFDQELYPLDTTIDGKYIIAGTQEYGGYLRIVKIIDENNVEVLTLSSMPIDLQPFYGSSSYICFNKYTGILTAIANETREFVVMRYINDSWEKITIDISNFLQDPIVLSGRMTISDDLSRMCVGYLRTSTSSTIINQIINLSTQTGYIAQNYGFYNVNSDTITGYATENAAMDTSFEANVAGAVS